MEAVVVGEASVLSSVPHAASTSTKAAPRAANPRRCRLWREMGVMVSLSSRLKTNPPPWLDVGTPERSTAVVLLPR